MNIQTPGVSLEIVAAISAALSAALDREFVITSIAPAAQAPALLAPPSGWAKAGVLESHLVRRQFGLRLR